MAMFEVKLNPSCDSKRFLIHLWITKLSLYLCVGKRLFKTNGIFKKSILGSEWKS